MEARLGSGTIARTCSLRSGGLPATAREPRRGRDHEHNAEPNGAERQRELEAEHIAQGATRPARLQPSLLGPD
jgi:hypothetical protein